MSTKGDYVQALAAQLQEGLEQLAGGETNVVWGVNDRCIIGNRALVINQIRQILLNSKQIFICDGNIVFEQRLETKGRRLITLMQGDELLKATASHLANLFHCAMPSKDDVVTYQPPPKVIAEVLNNVATRDLLPHVDWYSRRPVFDKSFNLYDPGYHSAEKILVHGEAIMPTPWSPPAVSTPLDRLPPGLCGLLKDFCFDTPTDLVNIVAMLLTGLLMNHLVAAGKPVLVINGNQKGIGKTLLAIVLGIILDGSDPPLIHYTEDEDELGKRLGARIKPEAPFSVLFFDNRKGSIGGSLLESLALAPRVNVRMLGHNLDISRANDFLWIFTANHARATDDMTQRSVLVQLHYEGDPKKRFTGTTIEEEALKRYAREHRNQIVGELLGMVIRWREAGKPLGTQEHRCKRWAELIGGILHVAGLDEFLSNQDEVIAELDEDLQELVTLTEHLVSINKIGYFTDNGAVVHPNEFGKKSQEWLPIFRDVRLRQAELTAAGAERAQAAIVGKFFSSRIGRVVPVHVGDKTGNATVWVQPGRSRQRRYWIEISWNDTVTTPTPPACGSAQINSTGSSSSTTMTPALAPVPPPEVMATPEVGGGGNNLDW